MPHNYLTCIKNLKDCRWCRLKAEKLSLKHGYDIQYVDYAVTFAENPILKSLCSCSISLKAQNEPSAEEIKNMDEKNFQKLVQDCKKIVARGYEDIIRRRHELGMRILEDEDKYVKHKWGSGGFVKRLASDIDVKPATVYYAIRFAEKYPDIEKFLMSHKLHGESLNWRYIVHNLLYEPKPKPKSKSLAKLKSTMTELKSLKALEFDVFNKAKSLEKTEPKPDIID